MSADVGCQLWLIICRAVPSLVDATAYLMDISAHMLAPWFLHVLTAFYRNMVECTATVLDVSLQAVKGIVVVVPRLGSLLGTGIREMFFHCVEMMWSVAVFFIRFFLYLIFMIRMLVEFVMQCCVTIGMAVFRTAFSLVQVVGSVFLSLMYLTYDVLLVCFHLFTWITGTFVTILWDMRLWILLAILISTTAVVMRRLHLRWPFHNVYYKIKSFFRHFVTVLLTAGRDDVDFRANEDVDVRANGDVDVGANDDENVRDGEASNLASETSGFQQHSCVVCFYATRDTVLFPCRHLNLCGKCAKIIMKRNRCCPVCRERVEKMERVFL